MFIPYELMKRKFCPIIIVKLWPMKFVMLCARGIYHKGECGQIRPNLILLRFKVKTNGVLCLLDSRATHSFVNLSVIVWLEWVATKLSKPIKVQLAQGVATPTNKVGLGSILECGKAKFTENFMICALDGIGAILGNTFLKVYCIDVLKGGLKLRVITKLTYRSIIFKVES